MKKVIIKEADRVFLVIDIMLYTIYAAIGYILVGFPEVELLSPIEYAPILFFMFGFFSLLAYFLNRRIGDYEYLFFGLINITTASFILINSFCGFDAVIISSSLIFYTVEVILNKLYHVYKLILNKDINFYPKIISIILILMLGILVIDPLFSKYCAASIILGYYFIAFGLINLLEPLFMILIRNPKLDSKLCYICGIEKEKPSKKKKTVLKEIKRKKISKSTKK